MSTKFLVAFANANAQGSLQSPEVILARMLDAPVVAPTELAGASADRIVVFVPGDVCRMPASARAILCVAPDTPLESLAGLNVGRLHRLVVQTPIHHLYALEALKLPATHIELIPPGVDHRFFVPASDERAADLVVVPAFAGIDSALATQLLKAREGRFELACERGQRASLPAGLPTDITVREVTAEERRDLFRRAAAVVIAPASRESASGWQPLLEAMACATPVIAASTFGLEHLLVAEREGLLFPAGNVNEARALLRKLLSDATLGRRLAQAARAKVEVALTCEHWAARMARICRAPANATQPEFYLIAAHGVADSQEAPA